MVDQDYLCVPVSTKLVRETLAFIEEHDGTCGLSDFFSVAADYLIQAPEYA
jgi:hypothetical protein